jgi:Hydrazine synthase alpha subunit middle domain/WD40-like Beta Propeller Repeat
MNGLSRLTCTLLALVLVLGAVGVIRSQEAKPAATLLVRAYEFDRGNVAVYDVGGSYADKEPVIVNGGVTPNTTEYDLDIPVTATFELFVRYTAQESRPVDILLDDQLVVRGLKSVTGSWNTSGAIWEKQADVSITAGKHTIKFVCPGACIPHIVAFRLDSPVPFPQGWKRKPKPIQASMGHSWSGRPEPGKFGCEAYVRPDGFVDAPPDYDPMTPFDPVPPPTPRGEKILEYLLMGEGKYNVQATVEQDEWGEAWQATLSVKVSEQRTEVAVLPLSADRVEKMLSHTRFLITRFRRDGQRDLLADEDGRAGKMLGELEALRGMGDGDQAKWQGIYDLYVRAYLLKSRVALSNPLLGFGKLLFAKRLTYDTSHIYTTHFDGSHRYAPGGGIYTLSPIRPDAQPQRITGELADTAIYRDPDVSWDGRKVLFSYKPDLPTPYRICEANVDGTGLRQVTDSNYDDVDPCYLPDGRIVFVSTRCRRVVLCHNVFTVSVLYTMSPDGSDVRCISPNTVNEFTPSILADGRITFTRWEYVDKHVGNNQSMWVANPDGTSPVHMSGEHWGPITMWEPRQVPGSSKIVCTLAPHMPIAVGPIALVDPADVCTSPAKYENLNPEMPAPHHFGWARTDVGYYCDPYPLSEDFHVVSYGYGPDDREPTGYALYLLDRWNNRDLIYRDPDLSCFEAFPVMARERPPVLPPVPPSDQPVGRFFVMDVYQGLTGIERGAVKYLRVIEEVPKPVSADIIGFGLQNPAISNYGHYVVKKLWGEVPVEPDGSVYFEAPANAALYFAAVDANYMELQRMRALTMAAPGETVSCVGCHEHRTTAPPNTLPVALRHAPLSITPPIGGVHGADFAYDAQPVLTRNCASCHSGDKPAGNLDLSPDPTNIFNVAYENLTSRGYVSYVDVRRADSLPLRPPMYYGSHASKVIEVLETTHKDRVHLSPEDFRRLVTWIDCNAPYYGTYVYSRPGTVGGRELVTPGIRASLKAVYDKRCVSCHGQDAGRVERIKFLDVEKSPALLAPLAKTVGGTERCGKPVFETRDDPDCQALLNTLHKLAEEIRANPREDMLAERPPITKPDMRYVYRP